MSDKLVDPDCRDGKHRSCVGGMCECSCHWTTHNLAADIAELETELGIGEPCCDGICIHHMRMEEL